MEDILAITFIFGGGSLFLLSISPVGKALADRIRAGSRTAAPPAIDEGIYEELDRLRSEMNEVYERLDFAERLLTDPERNATRSDRPPTAPSSASLGGGH